MSTKIEKFEDLNIWKESMHLSMQIYQELKECTDFGLKDQIQRASVSVPSNIAEGFERNSNNEFIRFLYISKASAGEIRTQLYLCKELGLIENKRCDELIDQSRKFPVCGLPAAFSGLRSAFSVLRNYWLEFSSLPTSSLFSSSSSTP